MNYIQVTHQTNYMHLFQLLVTIASVKIRRWMLYANPELVNNVMISPSSSYPCTCIVVTPCMCSYGSQSDSGVVERVVLSLNLSPLSFRIIILLFTAQSHSALSHNFTTTAVVSSVRVIYLSFHSYPPMAVPPSVSAAV